MRAAALALLGCLTACGLLLPASNTPDAALAGKIEDRLAKVACVGSLRGWQRSYWYARTRSGWIDRNTFEIDLRQAGFEEFRHGRYRFDAPPKRLFGIDDREYRIAFGSFDVVTARLTLRYCGPSMD